MVARSRNLFDRTSTPLPERIAQALHKIGLALKHQTWSRANAEGLSPTQGQILAALTEGPLSGSELAGRLGVKLPTISEAVGALVDKGLAEKSKDPRHPRARLVHLTPDGRAAAGQARAWPELLAGAVQTLSPEEQVAFNRGLLKMIRSLQDDGLIPVQRMCITCTHFRPRVYEGERPHYCALVEAPMGDGHLRGDCPDHVEAEEPQRTERWQRFLG